MSGNFATEEEMELRGLQNDLCGICREPMGADACVDHDHKTGEIRGLLHRKCNAALGGFKDNYKLVQAAALYLHRGEKDSIHPWAVIGDPPEHRDWTPGMVTHYPEIHPTARINSFVTVDAGLHEPTRVGAHTFAMSKSHVGHDAQIGKRCELAPGTVIGGHAVLEDEVRCGIGVLVRPGVRIGAGARLGAGAVVVKDVPAGETWVGNPAHPLEVYA